MSVTLIIVLAIAVAAVFGGAIGIALGWAASRLPPDAEPACARRSTRCCRRHSAGNVAIRVVGRTPKRSPTVRPISTGVRQVARRRSARLRRCSIANHGPWIPTTASRRAPLVAWIDEERCIGCARCLPACPVDAIVGAPRFMHTVMRDDCTGCELCLAPCPVDCIELRPAAVIAAAPPASRPRDARIVPRFPPGCCWSRTSAWRCASRSAVARGTSHRGARAGPGLGPRGDAAVVKAGDIVGIGTVIARDPDGYAATLHAPVSGRVRSIERLETASDNGWGTCVVIENDGADRRDVNLRATGSAVLEDPRGIDRRAA